MKHFLILFGSMLFFATSTHGQVDPIVENGTREEVVFTVDQDKRSLEQIRKEIVEHGVHLKYDDLQFGTQGQLQAITFSVKDMTDSTQHASSLELAKQVLFGFEFYHQEGKAVVTRVGEMGEQTSPPAER